MRGRHRLLSITGLSLCALAQPAFAQDPGSADLLARVEALERQVTDLRAENASLRAQMTNIKEASSSPAPAAAAPPGAIASYEPAPPPGVGGTAPAARQGRWDRAYVGISAGFTQTRNRQFVSTDNGLLIFRSNKTGPSIGLKLGRRWQRGALVSGLELQGVLTERVDIQSFGGPEHPPHDHYQPKSYVNMKGQLGWDAGPLLLYATGGVRVSQVHNVFIPGRGPFVGPDNVISLMYGAGFAIPLSRDLSFHFDATISKLKPHPNFDGDRATQIDALAGVELGF